MVSVEVERAYLPLCKSGRYALSTLRERYISDKRYLEIRVVDDEKSQVNPPPPAEEEEEEDEEDEVNDEETEGFYQNKEEEFNLMDFLKRFVSPQVLRAYITLLGEYRQLSAHTLHCTVKMLHRLAVDLCMTPMLFQARLFRIFQKVLTDPACHTKQYQELFGLAKYIVRKFFELAETNPKVYVELFFWKTNREAIEMTEGYGSIKENASKTKQIWTEEQDDELRQLYDQHKDAKLDGGDPVDNIMSELIDQTKTRRMIVKHLIALDLVGTARELKPLKSGNRAWREEEILELRELVDQYRESNDPMVNILSGLTTKRSKYKVMEKCVELNLVGNRKELHKKKAGGGGGSGRRKRRSLMSSSEDEMGDNDDNDEIGDNDDNNDMESEPGERIWSDDDAPSGELGDSEGDDDTDEQPLYIMRIKQAVRHAIKKGLAEAALEWIRKCLTRTADDRDEDDDDESIPLVPLLDEQEEAMDNSAFRAILRAVGIKPPANEQEQFWRIPGNFNAADLRSRASVLVTPSAEELKKKPSGKYRALKDLAKIRKRKMDNIKKPEPKKPTKTAAEPEPEFKSREFLSSDTESSDDDDNPRLRIVEGNEAVTAPVNRRTSNTDDTSSSSESEDDKNKSVRDKDDSSSDDDDDDDKSSSRKARSKHNKSDSSRDDDIQSSSSKARSKRDPSSFSSDDDVQSISSKARSKRDRSSSGSDGDRSSSSDDNDGDGGSSSDDDAAGGGTGRMDHSMIDEDSMSSHSKRSRRAMSEESDKSAQPSKRARVQPESEDERKTKNTEPGSFPATLLTQPIGSDDSDVDDHVPIKRGAKRPAIIDSDSD